VKANESGSSACQQSFLNQAFRYPFSVGCRYSTLIRYTRFCILKNKRITFAKIDLCCSLFLKNAITYFTQPNWRDYNYSVSSTKIAKGKLAINPTWHNFSRQP
jgi:hypothetical protein